MGETAVFAFKNYKSYIQSRIANDPNNWGVMTKLAKAAGCQRPYLSRVLSSEAHLTPAQAFGLSKFWGLTENESEYFLALLELERAGSPEYQEYWKRKLADAKKRHENISKLVNRASAAENARDLHYYSAWYWTAIHILVSIPKFQSEAKIAEKLNLSILQVRSVLLELESWGAVRREGTKWLFHAREQHIPKDSPLVSFHHQNWRQQAVISSQLRKPESIHYTVVQSVSFADYERIKQVILEMIQNTTAIAGPSKEEQLMCMTCDFFEP